MIEELRTYTQSDVDDLDCLMHELSSTSFCNATILDDILNDKNAHAYVIREEGHVVGAGTLCVMHTLEFTIANIESVVVSSLLRGKGYGRKLVEYMISEARSFNVRSIHLTSNPKRLAANELYQRLGFRKYETNCYVFDII